MSLLELRAETGASGCVIGMDGSVRARDTITIGNKQYPVKSVFSDMVHVGDAQEFSLFASGEWTKTTEGILWVTDVSGQCSNVKASELLGYHVYGEILVLPSSPERTAFNGTCPICLEHVETGVTLSCGHKLHAECAQEMCFLPGHRKFYRFKKRLVSTVTHPERVTACPLCREPISVKAMGKLRAKNIFRKITF